MADIKLLMVADGDQFGFGPQLNTPDVAWFALTHLVAALRGGPGSTPSIQVDTAHRRGHFYAGRGNMYPDTSVGLTFAGDFTFVAMPAVANTVTADLADYDVLWLMGFEGWDYSYPADPGETRPGFGPITDDERIAIADFMVGGGGVFATGDHDGLGGFLCDQLPRVRTMRKWHVWGDTTNTLFAANWNATGPATAGGATDRFDSIRPDANNSGLFYFDGQSDAVPQATLGPDAHPLGQTGPVHPILRDRTGAVIAWWPDHMHEGEATDFAAVSATATPFDPDGGGAPGQVTYQPSSGPAVSFVEFPTVAGWRPEPEVIAWGSDLGHATQEPGLAPVPGQPPLTPPPPDPPTTPKTAPVGGATAGVEAIAGKVAVYDGRGVGVGRIVTGASLHHYIDLNLLGDPGAADLYPAPEPTGTDTGLQGLTIAGADVQAGLDDYYINTAVWLARAEPAFEFLTVKNSFSADEAAAVVAPGFVDAFYLALDGYTPAQIGADPVVVLAGPLQSVAGAVIVAGAPIYADFAAQNTPQQVLFPFTVQSIQATAFPAAGAPPIALALEARITVAGVALSAEGVFELTAGENPHFLDVDPTVQNPPWLSQDLRVFQVAPGAAAPPFGVPLPVGGDGYAYIGALLQRLNADPGFAVGTSDPFETLMEQGDLTEASSIDPSMLNFAVARVRLSGTPGAQTGAVKVFFRLFATPTNDTDYDPQTTYLSSYDAEGLPDRPLAGLGGTSFPMFATLGGAGDYDGLQPANQIDMQVGAQGQACAYFGCYLDVYGVSSTPPPPLVGTHHCLVAQIACDAAPIVASDGITPTPENCDKLAQRNIQITGA